MPYTNTWGPGGLYRKFTGKINGDEILESNFEIHTDSKFQDIDYIINDFTDVTEHSIEPAYPKVYATTDEVISATKGKLKIALVVTQESLIELANAYRKEMMGKRFECEIFQAVEDALEWVNRN